MLQEKLISSVKCDDIHVYYILYIFGHSVEGEFRLSVTEKTASEIIGMCYTRVVRHLSIVNVSPRDVCFCVTGIKQDVVGGLTTLL